MDLIYGVAEYFRGNDIMLRFKNTNGNEYDKRDTCRLKSVISHNNKVACTAIIILG